MSWCCTKMKSKCCLKKISFQDITLKKAVLNRDSNMTRTSKWLPTFFVTTPNTKSSLTFLKNDFQDRKKDPMDHFCFDRRHADRFSFLHVFQDESQGN